MNREERERRERKEISRELGSMRIRLERIRKIQDYSYPSGREAFAADMDTAMDAIRRAEDSVMQLSGFCGYVREWV